MTKAAVIAVFSLVLIGLLSACGSTGGDRLDPVSPADRVEEPNDDVVGTWEPPDPSLLPKISPAPDWMTSAWTREAAVRDPVSFWTAVFADLLQCQEDDAKVRKAAETLLDALKPPG